MGPRRRAREAAVQILFQLDANPGQDVEEALSLFEELAEGVVGRDEATLRMAEELVRGVRSSLALIDELLRAASPRWRVDRMDQVDRNVLRLAAFELSQRRDEVPAAVAIDEAIEVARRFGSERSAAFINGVLEALRVRLEGEVPEPPEG